MLMTGARAVDAARNFRKLQADGPGSYASSEMRRTSIVPPELREVLPQISRDRFSALLEAARDSLQSASTERGRQGVLRHALDALRAAETNVQRESLLSFLRDDVLGRPSAFNHFANDPSWMHRARNSLNEASSSFGDRVFTPNLDTVSELQGC